MLKYFSILGELLLKTSILFFPSCYSARQLRESVTVCFPLISDLLSWLSAYVNDSFPCVCAPPNTDFSVTYTHTPHNRHSRVCELCALENKSEAIFSCCHPRNVLFPFFMSLSWIRLSLETQKWMSMYTKHFWYMYIQKPEYLQHFSDI